MDKGLALLLAAGALLAGCTAPITHGTETHGTATTGPSATAAGTSHPATATTPAATPSAPPLPTRMAIHGVVVDEALRPLRANVTLLETNTTRATGADGVFRFADLRPDVYFLTARAAGHRSQTLSVTPEGAQDPVRFVLAANPSDRPHNTTVRFRGMLECALEALIVSPSCDALVTDEHGLGQPDLAQFNSTNSVTVDVQDGWRTVVADVVFDASSQPLLDGLRVTVQGTRNQSALGTYQQYGRFDGKESFTFRLEPGATYDDTTAGAVPQNTTAFRFDVYPQSLGWHAVCDPSGGTCFLGVGAGTDVQFDLYITTFYGAPAPSGFTLRGAA